MKKYAMDAFRYSNYKSLRFHFYCINGFSFIEVLVALFLVTTGVLSLSAFHIANLRAYQHNFQLMQGRELLRQGTEFISTLGASSASSSALGFDVNDFLLTIQVQNNCQPMQACREHFCTTQQLAAEYRSKMQCLAKQVHPRAVLNSYCIERSPAQPTSCSNTSVLYFELTWPTSAADEFIDCQSTLFEHQRCVAVELQL